MPKSQRKKEIRIIVSPEFHVIFEKTARKRYINTWGYRSKFGYLGIYILIKLDEDPSLVKKINRHVNNSYFDDNYEDRLSKFIIECIKEKLEKVHYHNFASLLIFNKLIILHIAYFCFLVPIHIIHPSYTLNPHQLLHLPPFPS